MSEPETALFWRSVLLCRCPRCGQGALFSGYLKVAPRCAQCGLDLTFAEHGDGPAVFVVLIAGALVLSTAMFVELRFAPPMWAHALILGPLTVGLCLGLLPLFKSLFVALQFRYARDEEG
jgi:uncharacterized protein (DUF983 family)